MLAQTNRLPHPARHLLAHPVLRAPKQYAFRQYRRELATDQMVVLESLVDQLIEQANLQGVEAARRSLDRESEVQWSRQTLLAAMTRVIAGGAA